MRTRLEWKWEKLDENTQRAQVFGGWLVLHSEMMNNKSLSESLCFVPDRDHSWTILVPKADPQVERSAMAKEFEPKA